jgi:hypothetical protein
MGLEALKYVLDRYDSNRKFRQEGKRYVSTEKASTATFCLPASARCPSFRDDYSAAEIYNFGSRRILDPSKNIDTPLLAFRRANANNQYYIVIGKNPQ